jgi:hypothetical protein
LLFLHVGDVGVGNDDLPAVGLQKTHDLKETDRFADAAPTDDRECLSGIDVEINVVQYGMVERLTDILELDVVGELLRFWHRLSTPSYTLARWHQVSHSSGVLTL